MARFALICFLALAILMPACSSRNQEKLEANTFHFAISDDVKTLDPASAYDTISSELNAQIFEALYQYDFFSNNAQVIPLLAADMPSFSPDKLTVTIPIKKGIRFQDDPCFDDRQGKGREVTAQDFVYAIKRLALPSLRSEGWWAVAGKIVGIEAFREKLIAAAKSGRKGLKAAFEGNIEGLKAVDPLTLRIKLTQPTPQLTHLLSLNFFAPMAHEAVDRYEDEKGHVLDHPVGTGPFRLKRWQRQNHLELVKNPTYHAEHFPVGKGTLTSAGKRLPFVERLVFKVIKDEQLAWSSFIKGKLDALVLPHDFFDKAIIHKTQLTPELTENGIRLEKESGTDFYYISFNTLDPILKNKYLRQALSSAIDRKQWIDTFTHGTGQKMSTVLPPGLADQPSTSQPKYDFDLNKANALLKKAGYPSGKGLPVLNFDLRGTDAYSHQLGEFFLSQWKRLGIQVNVVLNTFPAFLEKARTNRLQIAFGGWRLDYPDADNVLQLFYGPNRPPGPNESGFDHPLFNRLYEKMASMEPGPARAALIQKMDTILQEECPWALGYAKATYELVQPWVFHYRSAKIISNRMKYIMIDPEIRKKYRDVEK